MVIIIIVVRRTLLLFYYCHLNKSIRSLFYDYSFGMSFIMDTYYVVLPSSTLPKLIGRSALGAFCSLNACHQPPIAACLPFFVNKIMPTIAPIPTATTADQAAVNNEPPRIHSATADSPPIENNDVQPRRSSPRLRLLAAAAAANNNTAATTTAALPTVETCPCAAHRNESVKAKLVYPRKKRSGESKAQFKERLNMFKTQKEEDLILQQADYFLGIGELPRCKKKSGDAKGSLGCNCLSIFSNNHLLSTAVARYCVNFWKETNFKQDQTIIEWEMYGEGKGYRLPVFFSEEDDIAQVSEQLKHLQTHRICASALCTVMDMSYGKLNGLMTLAKTTGCAKQHGNTGKRHRAYKEDSDEIKTLHEHMELLEGLAEVRATREVKSWSDDGTTVLNTLRDNNGSDEEDQKIYLPSYTGYRTCYNRYLKSCGYEVQRTSGTGVMTIMPLSNETQKNYVSYYKYYCFWKEKYPRLLISKAAEDICNLCFQFANRHKYQKSLTTISEDDAEAGVANDIEDASDDLDSATIPSSIDNDLFREGVVDIEPRRSSRPRKPRNERARNLESDSEDDGGDLGGEDDGVHGAVKVESNNNQVSVTIGGDEPIGSSEPISIDMLQLEGMLKRAAIHVEQAEVQRREDNYYNALAVADARSNVPHSERTYKLTADYGQVMLMPIFAKEQPGFSYYVSKWSVQNFGVVNHAHKYNDDRGYQCHMDAHVFQEGVSQKGANSVASMIMKSLRDWGIIKDGEVGGHLVITFDNCGGQNKNNCMIQLLMFLYEQGYFKKITFLFLVAGHTKNACDRIFNLLKLEYRKQNLYTMDELEEALRRSSYVTVKRAVEQDFLDWTKFLEKAYPRLVKQINQNHVFRCGPKGDGKMDLRNAEPHQAGNEFSITVLRSYREDDVNEAIQPINCIRKKWWNEFDGIDFETAELALPERVNILKQLSKDRGVLQYAKPIPLNAYKVVEMWNNFIKGKYLVEPKYINDPFYKEPTPEQWAVVKKEKKMNKVKKEEVKQMKREATEAIDESVKPKKPRTTDTTSTEEDVKKSEAAVELANESAATTEPQATATFDESVTVKGAFV